LTLAYEQVMKTDFTDYKTGRPQPRDLNRVVNNILQNRKWDFMDSYKKRRFRLSDYQAHLLELEFKANSNWNKKDIVALAKKLHLSIAKLYKWNWDRKKKAGHKDLFQLQVVNKEEPGMIDTLGGEDNYNCKMDDSMDSETSHELDNTKTKLVVTDEST